VILTTRFLGAAHADAPLVVLLHGVTAPGDQLVPVAETLAARPALAHLRFAVPEAPIALEGFAGGRSWWPVPIGRLVRARARGEPNDLTRERPNGMCHARGQLATWLAAVATPDAPVVLAGFSQGAMLACEFALREARRLAGLVLLSGTIVGEDDWTPRLPRLAGLPVLMTHGESDPVLLHATAVRLRDLMSAAGARVSWCEYPGGHDIADVAVDATAEWLAEIFR
jgi:phospholipase/carboxylesterase